MIRSITIWY